MLTLKYKGADGFNPLIIAASISTDEEALDILFSQVFQSANNRGINFYSPPFCPFIFNGLTSHLG
jgi:hypothetical protein